MIGASARLGALAVSAFLVGCIRVPPNVASEFCAQPAEQSHFTPGTSRTKPNCCMPRPVTVAKSGSAVEGSQCTR